MLAQAETRRLLALAPLPSRRTALPDAVLLPGQGGAVSTALVDTAAAWKVPMSLTASLAWARAHPPAGLPLWGTSSAGSSGMVTSTGLTYSAPSSRHWVGAELAVTLSPAGPSTTNWRIDGMAEWLDPKPQPDSDIGRRVHVTAASGCPESDRGVVGVINPGGGLAQAFLPPAMPTGVLLCDYEGLNGRPFRLRLNRPISTGPARVLAQTVLGLSLSHVDGLESACPAGDASATVLAFAYPGRTVDLWYQRRGCPWLANGAVGIATPGGTIGPLVDAVGKLLH